MVWVHTIFSSDLKRRWYWLTVLPSTVNGTELGDQEWRGAIYLRYGLEPPDIPTYCERCQSKFSISHALDCKKGGLITARHNELRDGVADLADKAFTSSHMCDYSLIYSGCAVRRTKAMPARTNGKSDHPAAPEVMEQKGDLLIRDLWQQGTNNGHDMRVVNTDALTYYMKEPEKCLHEAEKRKKNMYLEACLQQRPNFYSFVSITRRRQIGRASSSRYES